MPEHNLQSRINKSFADKRLPHLKTLLQLSHRLTLFPAFLPLTSRIRPRDEDFVKSENTVWRSSADVHLAENLKVIQHV